MLNGGNVRGVLLDGRNYRMLAGLAGVCVTLLLLLAQQGLRNFGWPVALAVLLCPFFIGWSIPTVPVAWRKARSLVSQIRGPHWIIPILFTSCYLEQFFAPPGVRNAGDVQQNPVNGLNLVRIGLIAVAGCIAIMTAIQGRMAHRPWRSPGSPLLSLLGYSTIALGSATYASLPLVSAGKALEFVVDVVAFIVLSTLVTSEDVLRYWNLFWLILALMVAGVCISAGLNPTSGFEYQVGAMFPILTGWCPSLHPNTLGQFSATLAVIGMSRLLARWKVACGHEKMLWFSVFSLGVLAMIGAQARTSLASFGVAFLAILIWYRQTGMLLAGAIAGLLVALSDFGGVFMNFVRRGQDSELLTTLSGRTYYWQEAWDMFRESMLTGHGFYTAHRLDLTERFRVLDLSTVDNTYLEVLLDVGIIGIIPFLLALILLLAAAWRSRNIQLPARLGEARVEMIAYFFIILARSFTGPSFQVHGENLLLLLILMSFTQSIGKKRGIV